MSASASRILVCTLGASWPVVAEILAALAPDLCPLFRDHPDPERLAEVRRRCGDPRVDELWVVTTGGNKPRGALTCLREWWALLDHPLPLRVWCAADTGEVATTGELERLRELTFRVALRAAGDAGTGALLSLAGGRKTMSADLQRAGSLFGCAALLHVVAPEPLPKTLREWSRDPARWTRPLPADLVEGLAPAFLGSHPRLELLDIAPVIDAGRYPLPEPAADGKPCEWTPPDGGTPLVREVERRDAEGSQLLGNYLGRVAQEEPHESWRSLYRLPPREVEALRSTRLGEGDRPWLLRLPKADLHRHLGGCLDLAQQRRVGGAVWEAMSRGERQAAQAAMRELLDTPPGAWPWAWPERLKPGEAEPPALRSHRAACLLVEVGDGLDEALVDATEPRLALKTTSEHEFKAYERPGELTGSAILQHEAAVAPYAEALVAQARAEGLAYVELRGSPQKYLGSDGLRFLRLLRDALRVAGGAVTGGSDEAARTAVGDGEVTRSPWFRFVVIADRRAESERQVQAVVDLAVRGQKELEGFVVGIDLAGDESATPAADLATPFEPAFRACLPVTIHAGEGEAAESIWEAAYRLHADRIGHGLTLAEAPELARRFRDRRICLELCPTSNREVVGFRDPAVPGSEAFPLYPFRRLWDLGLHLTLCTDNPGISHTTLADEYLAAARMDGGLTRWEALTLMKHAFTHAFLPAEERERLAKAADLAMFRDAIQE